jgi:hypothetical protein
MHYASLHSRFRMIAAPREVLENFSGGNPIGVAHARASANRTTFDLEAPLNNCSS